MIFQLNQHMDSEFTSIAPSAADLEKINRYTRKALRAEEVYSFRILLCDNEIDRDLERFDRQALNRLATLFLGKTGIFNHSMNSNDQTARIYDTEVAEDPQRLSQCGEPYASVRAKAYMPRTAKNADLIAEIEAGIKKETSVGCAVARVTCSVCGEELRSGHCGHKRGKSYNGIPCHAVLSEPTDAYEWSFVAVPAQRAAGVIKSYHKVEYNFAGADGPARPDDFAVAKDITALRQELEDYHLQLRKDTSRIAAAALPELPEETLAGICGKLSPAELNAFGAALQARTQPAPAHSPQLWVSKREDVPSNDAFQI